MLLNFSKTKKSWCYHHATPYPQQNVGDCPIFFYLCLQGTKKLSHTICEPIIWKPAVQKQFIKSAAMDPLYFKIEISSAEIELQRCKQFIIPVIMVYLKSKQI